MRVLLAFSLLAAEALLTVDGKSFSFENLTENRSVVVLWNSWVPQDPQFVALIREVERRFGAAGFAGAVVIFQEPEVERAAATLGPGPWPRVVDRRGVLLRKLGASRAPVVLVLAPGGEVQTTAGPDPASVRKLMETLARP
ncbi:MAG: TlpA family protein disulfide reductase [Acidobacteriota bacterium]